MKVFIAKYCSDTWESGYRTLSVHKSRETAERVIRAHKETIQQEHDELWKGDEDAPHWAMGKDWDIQEVEVVD